MRLEFKVYSLICGSLCVAALLLWTLITFFWCEEFDHFEQGAALENLAKLKTMITLQPEEIEKKPARPPSPPDLPQKEWNFFTHPNRTPRRAFGSLIGMR